MAINKENIEKVCKREKLYILIPVLLLASLLLGKYSILVFGEAFPLCIARNFLFATTPYFLLGDLLHPRIQRTIPDLIQNRSQKCCIKCHNYISFITISKISLARSFCPDRNR